MIGLKPLHWTADWTGWGIVFAGLSSSSPISPISPEKKSYVNQKGCAHPSNRLFGLGTGGVEFGVRKAIKPCGLIGLIGLSFLINDLRAHLIGLRVGTDWTGRLHGSFPPVCRLRGRGAPAFQAAQKFDQGFRHHVG